MTDNTKPSRLSALLKAPQPRQPIVIEGGGTKITVEIGEGLFERPDRGYGEYVARRAALEFHNDLLHADRIARSSVRGAMRKIMSSALTEKSERIDSKELVIDGQQVMQAWEHPDTSGNR